MGSRNITAIVLCGGNAARLGGVEKPLLPLGDRTLIEHVLDRLGEQLGPVIVSCRPGARRRYEALGHPLVHDRVADGGPVAGIAAGLHEAGTEWCLVCPGDTPVFPDDLPQRLWAAKGEADACYPEGQYLFLLVRTALAPSLDRWLARGHRRVQSMLAELGAIKMPLAPDDRFVNINTPAELDALKR